jgi:hypothetical protein
VYWATPEELTARAMKDSFMIDVLQVLGLSLVALSLLMIILGVLFFGNRGILYSRLRKSVSPRLARNLVLILIALGITGVIIGLTYTIQGIGPTYYL